jgi:hypothetical protein
MRAIGVWIDRYVELDYMSTAHWEARILTSEIQVVRALCDAVCSHVYTMSYHRNHKHRLK